MGENYRVSRKIFRVTEVFSAQAEACGYRCEFIFENHYKKQTLCGGIDCILMSPFFTVKIPLNPPLKKGDLRSSDFLLMRQITDSPLF